MITRAPHTFRSMPTDFGHLVIRIDAGGYELVWEIVGSAKTARQRCRYWRALEAGQVQL